MPADVDESRLAGEPGDAYVKRIALDKGRAILARLAEPDALVLAADTAVVLGGEIFGKPACEADALRMLAALSGRTHDVYTAVAVFHNGAEHKALSHSRVGFREVGDDEIMAYWRSGEPRDKAGAYAIQGLGAVFCAELRGSYSGVMGLPLFETAALLAAAGCDVLRSTG